MDGLLLVPTKEGAVRQFLEAAPAWPRQPFLYSRTHRLPPAQTQGRETGALPLPRITNARYNSAHYACLCFTALGAGEPFS